MEGDSGILALMETGGLRRRVWTDEQVDQAVRLHSQGFSVRAIGDNLGLSRSTTRRMLVRAGRIEATTPATLDVRRKELLQLVAHLTKGLPLRAAADATGLDVQHARTLIRSVADLAPEPLPARLAKRAHKVWAHLEGDDVRAAALAVGIDPWFALFLLLATGHPQVSMQPHMQGSERERAARMAERRAAGASFETIAAEFGIGRERARSILLATGGWTPRRRAQRP